MILVATNIFMIGCCYISCLSLLYASLNTGDTSVATDIPNILLSDENGKHEGVTGSYCWNGICVDKGLPKSNAFTEKIIKGKDTVINFDVEGNGRPTNFSVTVFSQDNEIVMTKTIEEKLDLNLDAGTYFINVMAKWRAGEGVSYIFLVELV
jgi:hypothetical protein